PSTAATATRTALPVTDPRSLVGAPPLPTPIMPTAATRGPPMIRAFAGAPRSLVEQLAAERARRGGPLAVAVGAEVLLEVEPRRHLVAAPRQRGRQVEVRVDEVGAHRQHPVPL